MRCYNHPREEAISQCLYCGKGLCEKCAKKWSEPICDDCQKKYINEELSTLNGELMLYIGLAVAGAIFGVVGMFSFAKKASIMNIPMLAICFPIYAAGWKWLNHLTDKFSLFATINIWVIYFFIKLCLSAFVGVVALPYRLFSIFTRKSELNSLLAHIK